MCFHPFADTVRTLACNHSFCGCCLSNYKKSKGITSGGAVDVVCPKCRVASHLTPEPTSRREKMVNELLLAVQEARLLYICPFDGCDSAFNAAELCKHVNSCYHRKHVCNRDQGCEGLLVGPQRHLRASSCLEYMLKDREKKDRLIKNLTSENVALKHGLHATASGLEFIRSTRQRMSL